jgi:L-alanine-DL-glutamate epimerase-like enolase superfamily enzyme
VTRTPPCKEVPSLNDGESRVPVEDVRVSVFTVPTDQPESDGTFEWNRTSMVLVEASSIGKRGIGYTYADTATAALIHDTLAGVVTRTDAMAPATAYMQMWRHVRNLGRPGICSMAISAVDCALWDLKAQLLNIPLGTLLGQVREAVPAYGSGGFTSYSDTQLSKQLSGWVQQGFPAVKMKIGRDGKRDIERVRTARDAIGPEAELDECGRGRAMRMRSG